MVIKFNMQNAFTMLFTGYGCAYYVMEREKMDYLKKIN